MCEICCIQMEVQYFLSKRDNRIPHCIMCRSPIEYRNVLKLPYTNQNLAGYRTAVEKARSALRRVHQGNASYVKYFFPQYPRKRTITEIRRSLRERSERVPREELIRLAQLESESSDDDDPSPSYGAEGTQ